MTIADDVLQALWREVARHARALNATPDLGSVSLIANIKDGRVQNVVFRTEAREVMPRDPEGRILAPTSSPRPEV